MHKHGMDCLTESSSNRYLPQQDYGFIAQSMDCLLGTLHKVWIKQMETCFVLRSLLIRVHAKLAVSSIYVAILIHSYVSLN